jgi:Tfp pilus assembly PilM family ATPase
MIRTGIDLGPSGVKLVRGEGGRALRKITHVGLIDLPESTGHDSESVQAEALMKLLESLRLGRKGLGKIAAGIGGSDALVREAILPPMTVDEIRSALPFEARRHLPVEAIQAPVLAFQVLGAAAERKDEDSPNGGVRVLIAAAPQATRDLVLRVLDRAGLTPEVVDLDLLAGMNALLGSSNGICSSDAGAPRALLDLGSSHIGLVIAGHDGRILARTIPWKGPWRGDAEPFAEWIASMGGWAQETCAFYKTRFHAEVKEIHLGGGGALRPGVAGILESILSVPVTVLDPFAKLGTTPSVDAACEGIAPRLATACGLCRWWDGEDAHV